MTPEKMKKLAREMEASEVCVQHEHGRQNAADRLWKQAQRLRVRAAELEALAGVLPPALAELCPAADLALQRLLDGAR